MADSKKIMVSVIIPLFQGNRYINKQIKQIEAAAKKNRDIGIELLLVSDDPENPIDEELSSDAITIRVDNSDHNRGIQRTRIRGLDIAKGEFIHFLDQDDEISPLFYCSQLKLIGNNDVVYCRGYFDRRPIYDDERKFEESFSKCGILSRPPMGSPGQALIRRDSISEFWKSHTLEFNGADDYMLWLCMFAEGRSFVRNEEYLYRHVYTGVNASDDLYKCRKSDQEMVDLLINAGIYKGDDATKLSKFPEEQFNRKYNVQKRRQIILSVLERLLRYDETDNGLAEILKRDGIRSVAIYGASLLGERIKSILSRKGIKVEFFIDRNADYLKEDISVYNLNASPFVEIDAVIISLVNHEEKVKAAIEDKYKIPVYLTREIAERISEDEIEWNC